MRIISGLFCILLLSSCVYYGVQRDFEIGSKQHKLVCDKGSNSEKKKCKADLKRLNDEIAKQY